MTAASSTSTSARAMLLVIGLYALGNLLLVTGIISAPLLVASTAGEPFQSWWDFVGAPLTFAGAVALLGVLAHLMLQVVSCVREGPANARLRLAARSMHRVPLALGVGLAALAAALLIGCWALSHESLEIIAGPANRRE